MHYIFDPLCGWCYAAAPLLEVAAQLAAAGLGSAGSGTAGSVTTGSATETASRFRVVLHAGGMMMGRQRQTVTPRLRDYVLPHDARIEAMTGQPFGAAYRDGLLRDPSAVFDSEPPITAILAAEQLAGAGLALLKHLQRAHYVQGRRIANADVLINCAEEIGLAAAQFTPMFASLQGNATLQHVEQSRRLLSDVGGRGFPTLVLETGGTLTVLPWSQYLGKPEQWREFLQNQLHVVGVQGDQAPLTCDLDSGAC
ncbi:DsbA family protein [Permianibacter fluminis]|uniref:DsbA family protein n=1 Tax=Permianibacter fluminis TaxID=2738515 RepID=UPI0038B2A2CE